MSQTKTIDPLLVQFANDLIKNKSIINFVVEFLIGREKLKDLKLSKHKKLIGSFYPSNTEMIWAAGGIPAYPIRMEKMGDQKLIRAMDLGRNLFGEGLLTQMLSFFRQYDKSKTIDNLVQYLFDEVFDAYHRVYDIGLNLGISNDACYGIKALSGMYANKGKNLSAIIFQSIRCSAFQRTYETASRFSSGIWIDIPPKNTPPAHESTVLTIHSVLSQLEKITVHHVTDSDLKNIAEITNQCKDYSWKIIELMLGDRYPIHPKTFSQLQALIEISFQDYLSDPPRFLSILKAMYLELSQKLHQKESNVDMTNYPKILFTPRFGGWDSIVEDYIYENGGRIIYADWFIYGFMNRIKMTGNIIENYADYLQTTMIGFGADNTQMVKNILHFVDTYHVDAVVYNQLFGCHSLSTGYYRLRQELMKREIPSTMVSFNQVGENREQLKTRIVALLELIKQ